VRKGGSDQSNLYHGREFPFKSLQFLSWSIMRWFVTMFTKNGRVESSVQCCPEGLTLFQYRSYMGQDRRSTVDIWGAGVSQRWSAGLRLGWSGVRIPEVAGNFFLHHRVQTGPGPHTASYLMSIRVKRPRCEVDHSPPFSAEVTNAWSYTSTSSICFHGVVLS
jgi:hypothetical protein